MFDSALTARWVDFDPADELLHKVLQPLALVVSYLTNCLKKHSLNLIIRGTCQRSCRHELGLATMDIVLHAKSSLLQLIHLP